MTGQVAVDHRATMWDGFRRSLTTNARRTAVVSGEQRTSYRELADQVAEAVARLDALGVEPGDRVGVLFDNVIEYLVVDLALMAVGGVKVPLNSMLSAPEIAALCERCGARALVASPALAHLTEQVAGTTVELAGPGAFVPSGAPKPL